MPWLDANGLLPGRGAPGRPTGLGAGVWGRSAVPVSPPSGGAVGAAGSTVSAGAAGAGAAEAAAEAAGASGVVRWGPGFGADVSGASADGPAAAALVVGLAPAGFSVGFSASFSAGFSAGL